MLEALTAPKQLGPPQQSITHLHVAEEIFTYRVLGKRNRVHGQIELLLATKADSKMLRRQMRLHILRQRVRVLRLSKAAHGFSP